jgi:hypothetical protein
MRISHTHKFVIINVPFNGAEFFINEFDKYSQIFGEESMQSEYYCHLKANDIKRLFYKKGWNWNDYLKIAVVRNPLDRIVNRHFELQKNKPKSEQKPFDEKIQYQLDWVNHQHQWTHDPSDKLLVDYVVRYEKIQTDFNFLCNKLKLIKTKLNFPEKYNKFEYKDFYDDETAKKCENHHKIDIHYFKFSKIFNTPTIKKSENKTLPYFLIPGFQKCGTSALWTNLKKHPQLNTSNEKELNYFNHNYDKGIDWYKSHFDETGEKWGEASVNYLYDFKQETLDRMYQTLPNTKIIISVRDPISRAYSSYNHYMQNIEKSKKHKGWLLPGRSFYENIVEEQKYNFTKGMVNVGFYWERLKKIYEYYPPEQVLLLKQEDMLATPDKIYAKIYKFLGVKYVKRTYGFSHRRKYNSKIDNKSFELLSEIYKSKNLELAENIGIDYNKKLFTDGTR